MGTFFVRAKKVPKKETRDLLLRSLIICNYSTPSGITRFRSNKFRFDIVSQTMITHFRKGRKFMVARRSFRRAERFAEGKTFYRQNDGLLQYEVLLNFGVFLFLWFYFFLFVSQAKRKK